MRENAAAARLPFELAVYIAVEAERALAEAVEILGVSRTTLIEFLDAASVDVADRAPRHTFVRPLEEYAGALIRGFADVEVPARPLRARVPLRVAAAWAHAAAGAGVPFERWFADAVADAPVVRATWEAAAARTGRALGEWVLLHATRCSRSRRTSPQTTASG